MGKESKPTRIPVIIGKWVGGGVEAILLNYYRHIDKNKIQFDFICDEDSNTSIIPVKEIEDMGGRVIMCPPYQKVFKYQKFMINLFKKNKYKIVHSNINTLSVFPLRAAKKAGVPVRIAHSHSTSNPKEWKKNLIKNILRPFSKKYANVYFACSELAGRYLFGNKTFDEGKVTIINNAIDVEKFVYNEDIRKKVRNELKEKCKSEINDDTLIVGHIGRFVKQKNHEFLIDIFNEIYKRKENSVLVLVGQGPLQKEIEEKVNNLGLQNRVLFLGQRNDANELYHAMDVFVLPSLYEGLPVVGVEAQAAGLLCKLSNAMTKETKILDTTNFIDLNLPAEVWAEKIIEDYEKFERKNVSKEFENNGFNIKKEAKKLEDKYYELLNDK